MLTKEEKKRKLENTLEYQKGFIKDNSIIEDITRIEMLPLEVLRENFGDYGRCESEWKEASVEDFGPEKSQIDYLKIIFKEMRDVIEKDFPDEYYPVYEDEVWLNELRLGRTIQDIGYVYRVVTPYEKCPRCGGSIIENRHAISRKDNETHVCTYCGIEEAFEDFLDIVGD